MAPFESYLVHIGNQITIKDEDRRAYTEAYDKIRDYMFKIMCAYDSNFKKICIGPRLFGSYSNNVRICYPSEFDVHMLLSFSSNYYIDVEEDEYNPGYVNLNLNDILDDLEDRNGCEDFINCLHDLVDYDSKLRRSNLQRWIESIIEGALDYYGDTVKGPRGDVFELEYSKRGLAHTIYGHGTRYNISIDFVPAILFGPEEWMDIRNNHPFQYKCTEWYAVPKPASGIKKSRKYAFMICNPKVEHDLLLGKNNLKVVFRLLKSLFKKYQMHRIKSYFITTAFLWEIEKHPDELWRKPLSDLLIHMLKVITNYFIKKDLPFFWNEDLNLLDKLYDSDIQKCAKTLRSLRNTLKSYPLQPNLSYERCVSHFKLP